MNPTTTADVIPFFLTEHMISHRGSLNDLHYFTTVDTHSKFFIVEITSKNVDVISGEYSSWHSSNGTLGLYNESWAPSQVRLVNFSGSNTFFEGRLVLLFREDEFKFLFEFSFDEICRGIIEGNVCMQVRLLRINTFFDFVWRAHLSKIDTFHAAVRKFMGWD